LIGLDFFNNNEAATLLTIQAHQDKKIPKGVKKPFGDARQ
jgi:hypothetical protein